MTPGSSLVAQGAETPRSGPSSSPMPAAAYTLTRRSFAEPIYEAVRRQRSLDEAAWATWSSDETLTAVRAYLASLAARG
mgnify:CR=1 FL=1